MYDHVIWPLPFDPKTSAIYALNDIDVNAPPEVVWKLLVDAENWSSYFPVEDQVKILSGEPELALGTKYSRVTVGFPMHLIVTEYVPGRRLAWSTLVDGDETASSAYHGWVITPTDTGYLTTSDVYTTRTSHLYRLDLSGWKPGGTIQPELLLEFPEPNVAMNGSCLLSPNVLLAGGATSLIWRVDLPEDGKPTTARIWMAHDNMKMRPGEKKPEQPGVNGVRYAARTGYPPSTPLQFEGVRKCELL
jgi:uncharacterized protein YndB with AHSA1/START domain